MSYRLGVVGTSWITSQFIQAAKKSDHFSLAAVYSRREETGQKIVDEFGEGIVKTDFEDFLNLDLDVVYIASPNSFHFIQTKQSLLHHKSVICEKPAATDPNQLAEIKEILLEDPDLFYFEAERNIYYPQMKIIKDLQSQIGNIDGASLNYLKRSSKFKAVEDGELPNVFSTKFAGGSLYDLGVYVVYFALEQFGEPDQVFYDAKMLSVKDGSDLLGFGILKYPNFSVELKIGKSADSFAPTEIYGEKGTILISNPADLDRIQIYKDQKEIEEINFQAKSNPLSDEANFFYKSLKQNDRDKMFEQLDKSIKVCTILKEMREDAGITFR